MTKNEEVMEKSYKKKLIIVLGIIAIVLVAILVYGFIITSTGNWLISKMTPDTEEQKISYSSASETGQIISDEGFVLLQNKDNLLPLETSSDNKTKINVFGMRAVQLVFNGGGSAATDPTKATKLEVALESEKGNYELNEDLLNLHYNFFKKGNISISNTSAPENGGASEFVENPNLTLIPEVPVSAYADTSLYDDGKTVMDKALEFSDTALIVIGRGGQENTDISPSMLQLSDEEAALIEVVCENFDDVILVVNSAHTLELGFLELYSSIKSVLWIGYPGESGAESLAKVLNGTVNPSGRLPDTWVYDNLSHISSNNYLDLSEDGDWIDGSYLYEGAPVITASAVLGGNETQVGYFLQYSEGIYVGYRYFETRHDTDNTFEYDSVVKYPFGYGLSYTSFEQDIMAMNVEDGVVTVRVSVENKGDVAGKSVIQVYYNPPYTGEIEKSTVNLVAFKKTNEIPVGETEYYSIVFNLEDMASYDYKVNESYILEAGDYEIMLKENSHDMIASEIYTLDEAIIYNEDNDGKRSTDLVVVENQFEDALGINDYLTRDWDLESRAFTGPQDSDYVPTQKILDSLTYTSVTDVELGYTAEDMPVHSQKLAKTIMIDELKSVDKNDSLWDEFISQLTIEELTNLCGNGAWQINGIERLGVPRTLTPDGSLAIAATVYSGAIMGTDGAGVTYPAPGVLASTWNQELAYLMGVSVAAEAKSFGYSGWYAPSMNIHRTPFDGRNFEYYSEDGVLSGKIAASVVKASQDNGLMTFVKHFIMHDRQKNGRDQIMKWSTEQAIREIYLKPFEIAVKEGGTLGVMSAFDFIGHTWAGGHDGLLNKVLRDEWGFEGLVVTDANIYPHMNVLQMLLGGGDLSLDVLAAWVGGDNHNKVFLAAAEDPKYQVSTITKLQEASKNILYAISRTWKIQN